MDKLDNRLILELAADARQSNVELSHKLGVSEKTVRRRIDFLVEKGIISWAIIPDPTKLGYKVRVFIWLEAELSRFDMIVESLSNCPNVDFVALCTGPFDILFGAWFTSSERMADFIKNYLSRIPGVRKSQTYIALDVKVGKIANMAYLHEDTDSKSEAIKE